MSITQVARLAGVSSSTVSRVINNHPRVAEETVKAVRAAMAKLNYTPSERRPGPKPAMANASRGKTIIFLMLGASNNQATPAFEQLMRGVSEGASKLDLRLVFHHVANPDDLPAHVLEGTVDGLLLHGSLPSAETREKLQRFPTVWLMGNRRRPDWGDQVMPDTYEIGDKAARYLLGRGHRHLAYMNLDRGHWSLRVTSQNFAARAVEEGADCTVLDRPRSAEEHSYWPEYPTEAVDDLVKRYLKLTPRPTGIFVADDMQVAIIQPALQRAGVNIAPGQVDIISCNNERPYLVGLSPKPAEIDIRVEAIGRRGVERLLWRVHNRNVPERMVTAIEPKVLSHDA
jgi:DNA-binding LacI/PurR family transcriptional regulator